MLAPTAPLTPIHDASAQDRALHSAAVNARVAAMARVMYETSLQSGGCTADDLARAGFTAAEILEHADDARALAGLIEREAA